MLIAQIFAFIAFILYVMSFQFKKKDKVLKYNIAANIFYTLEYIMLNAYAGVNNSIFGISRSIIFTVCDKYKVKFPIYGAIVFITLIILFGFISYTDIYSILPVIISLSFFLALFSENMRTYRLVAVMASILWIIYNCSVAAYVGAADACVELVSACIALYRFDIKKKKQRQFGYWKYYR